MRLVFDINAGDATHELENDIRDFVNATIGKTKDSYLLPLPDIFASHPLIERKYKFLLYSLGGNLLTDAKFEKVLKTIAIGFDNLYNGVPMYNEDWWQAVYPYTVGTTTSKSYEVSYAELLTTIRTRYAEIEGVHESEVDMEWLSFNGCDIYSESVGRIINLDYIGSRTIVSVLCTRAMMKSLLVCDHVIGSLEYFVKIYTVDNDVFSDDDDDDIIDYDEAV